MFEVSAVVLSSMTHFVHVNLELQSMVNESVPQTNYSKLWSWALWTCTSSTHPQTVFHQPLKCSLCLQVHFRVDNLLLCEQNVTCTHGFVLHLIGTARTKVAEVDNFSRRCYQALSAPRFLRREPGDKARQRGLKPPPPPSILSSSYIS